MRRRCVLSNQTLGGPRSPSGIDRLNRWAPALAAIVIITVLVAPRSTQVMSALLIALPVALLANGWRGARLMPLPTLLLGLMGFGVYIAVNAGIAVDKFGAYGKVAYFWALLAMSYLATFAVAKLDDDKLRAIARGVLIGVAIGAVLLMIESLFGQPLKRALFKLLPSTRLPAKHLQFDQGNVTGVALYVLNRSLAVLCLSLWPALLLCRALLDRTKAIAASVALTGATAIAVFPSEHETSMLALVFSLVTFAGMTFAAPAMRRLILASWLIATLLIVPIASVSYSSGLHHAKWIPETGRNRIILWGFTANEIKKAPIVGVGVASTKEIDEQAAATAIKPADHSYPLRTGRHSHNVFMQTWYELGAFGAVLLAIAGWLILRALSTLPPLQSAYAHAAFVTAVMIGAFSWGMWQTWFMAAYAIWALMLVLAKEQSSRTPTIR